MLLKEMKHLFELWMCDECLKKIDFVNMLCFGLIEDLSAMGNILVLIGIGNFSGLNCAHVVFLFLILTACRVYRTHFLGLYCYCMHLLHSDLNCWSDMLYCYNYYSLSEHIFYYYYYCHSFSHQHPPNETP